MFKFWAEQNIDVFKVLRVFELVPSPWREHEIINKILYNYQKKHGDTIYVLSYRWWDTWKEYTERNSTTIEVHQQQDKIRNHLLCDPNISEELRQCLLGLKSLDSNKVKLALVPNQRTPKDCEQDQCKLDDDVSYRAQDALELSHSMQQQIALINSRSIVKQNSSVLPTPRKADKLISNASIGDLSHRDADYERLNQHFDKQMGQLAIQPSALQNRGQQLLQGRVKAVSPMSGQIQTIPTLPDEPENYSSMRANSPNISQTVSKITFNILVKNQRPTINKAADLSYGLSKDEAELRSNHQYSKQHQETNTKKETGFSKKKITKVVFRSNKEQQHDHISQSLARLDSNLFVTHKEQPRPSSIDNSEIEGEHPGQLMPNLIQFRDFVILPESAWNLLCTWYGRCENSPVFARKILIHNAVPSLELYPPHIRCLLADTEGKPIPDSQKSLFVSSALSLGEVHLKICELFNYISTRDTRLWVKGASSDNEWTLVQNNNYNLKDGDIFMVEVKFYGNQWLMDSQTFSKKREWQQFEVGDKLDVYDGGTWKVGHVNKVSKDSLQIHFNNKNYKHDITVRKDSQLLARFGSHTLPMHFKQNIESSLIDKVNGIHNIGNTCYMNACIQSLLHTPLFRDFFKTHQYKLIIERNKKDDMISEAFKKFLDSLIMLQSVKDAKSCVADPSDFKKAINTTMPLFFGNQQHDAAEFLNFALDKMSEEMNRAVNEKSENGSEIAQGNEQVQAQIQQPSQLVIQEAGEIGGTGNSRNLILKTSAIDGPTDIQPTILNTHEQPSLQEENKKQGSFNLENRLYQSQDDQNLLLVKKEMTMIGEAKQSVYDEYFQRPSISNNDSSKSARKGRQDSIDGLQKQQNSIENSLNINPVMVKAKEAWYSELRKINSPVTDLFVGQQTTQITCMACNSKSFTFENFYSLPVPLPTNFNTTFYITLIQRSTETRDSKAQVTQFGVQINKFQPLSSLCEEVRKVARLDLSLVVCEVVQNKIYRLHQDLSTSLFFISKRTNQLYFYEILQPEKHKNQDHSLRKTSTKCFGSFEELHPGMVVDAQDQQSRWYVAIITAKDTIAQESRVRIHFYHLNESWDEWIEESDQNITRIRPLNSTGRATQPEDQELSLTLTQRRSAVNEGSPGAQIAIGLPYFFVLPNWFTWKQLSLEISSQICRHIKTNQIRTRSVKYEDDKLSEELESLAVDEQPDILEQSPQASQISSQGLRSIKRPKIVTASQQRLLHLTKQSYQTKQQTQFDMAKVKSKQNAPLETILEKPLEQSFKIKLFCSETQTCAFCSLKQRLGQVIDICKQGCEIPSSSSDMIKWTTCLFKNLELFVDWQDNNGESTYQDAQTLQDQSYIRNKQMESEAVTGVPLGQCLDLYSNKEKIEGYQCDHCNSKTQALLKPLISHLPDILILHLKRFNFDGGYLDKIEDLVTFPLRNLDMQKYTINGTKGSTIYDLYAVVNHHIYQTGGHYTASVQVKTQSEPVWVLTNDSTVSQLFQPMADIVRKDAYILFYRKREITPSNLLKLGDTL